MEKTTKINTPIQQLKHLLRKNKIAAYLIPSNDEFQQQSSTANRLQYMTNFTGSAGIVIITHTQCYFFTDGRYTEQAAQELDKNFKIINRKAFSLETWLLSFMEQGNKIGFDPKLHSINQIQYLQGKLKEKHKLVPIKKNLVDIIYQTKKSQDHGTVSLHNLKYTGQNINAKKKILLAQLKQNHRAGIILTDITSICWLLNIRALDIAFTPCMSAYLIIHESGKLELFTNAIVNSSIKNYLHKNNVVIAPLISFEKSLNLLKKKNIQISSQAAFFISQQLKNYTLAEDPCLLLKACKNKTELQGAINAGIRDSKALMKFFKWLHVAMSKTELTELDLANKLVQFRKEQKDFISPSFPSIIGFNENSAIIHYLPKKYSCKKITKKGLLLIDSGGQYLDGTTDTTRTIAIGKPSFRQIHDFTLVLKGHINLITAIFPEGTSGSQLDVLARRYLWHEGKDYDHGTGHGVGSCLAVHEGPHNIGKHYNLVPLQEGMIVSIEPGFYKPKSYGIRIESLVYVKKSKLSGYLIFEVLTYVPIDESLVDFKMLTQFEINWLKNYNKKCNEIFNRT